MPRRPILHTALALLLAGAAAAGCTSATGAATAARSSAGRGSYTQGSFDSAALNGVDHFSIYLPPGYATSGKRYSTIYLLHGLPDDGTGYRSDRAETIGEAAANSGRPVIVVAAQGARRGDTDPEWHDWGYGRDWETATAIELVHYIDTHYRTIADRHARGLIGISAGGYGASIIGVHHLDEYSVVESWSGYFHPTNPAGTKTLNVGAQLEQDRASLHSYVDEAQDVYKKYRPFFAFYVGDQDSRFLAENKQLDQELTAGHVPHVFAVYSGGHNGALWDEHQESWTLTAAGRLEAAH